MFDVCLVSPFNNHFRQIFHNLEKNDKIEFPTILSRLRNHAAQGIISAWAMASNLMNRIKSAINTGIYLINVRVVLDSRFIINLTNEQRARQEKRDKRRKAGLDINCKILTNPDMIEIISEKVIVQQRYQHLCIIPPPFANYSDLVRQTCNKCINGARFLSIPPPINHGSIIPDISA